MKRQLILLGMFAFLGILPLIQSDRLAADEKASKPADKQAAGSKEEDTPRVSLDIARDRAKLLHEVYASMLDVIHRRYFHADRAIVPARAMEDVFSDMERAAHIEARWIVANLKAMSVDHEPETPFEKQAARDITRGRKEVEIVEAGFYRRAVPVPLTAECISCHGGFFRKPSSTPKFAGLVISIPVEAGAKLEEKTEEAAEK
ncbi:MAG: c-type heme family protein [Planctomycetota bacterium]|jgi:hypothetical protein